MKVPVTCHGFCRQLTIVFGGSARCLLNKDYDERRVYEPVRRDLMKGALVTVSVTVFVCLFFFLTCVSEASVLCKNAVLNHCSAPLMRAF